MDLSVRPGSFGISFSQICVCLTSHVADELERIKEAVGHFCTAKNGQSRVVVHVLSGNSLDSLAATIDGHQELLTASGKFDQATFENRLGLDLGLALDVRFHYAPFLLTSVELSSSLPVFTCADTRIREMFPAMLVSLGKVKKNSGVSKHISSVDANQELGKDFRTTLKKVGHYLVGLCSDLQLDVTGSCFTAGYTATLLGNFIAKSLGKEEASGWEKTSLVLVDRTLDVAAPLLQLEAPLLQSVNEVEVDAELGFDTIGQATLQSAYDVGANALLHELLFRPRELAKRAASRRFEEIFGIEFEGEDFAVEALLAACEDTESAWMARLPECQVLAIVFSWLRVENEERRRETMSTKERQGYEQQLITLNDRTNLLVLMNILVKSRERQKDLFDILILAIIAYSMVGESPGFDADIQQAFEASLEEAVAAENGTVGKGFPEHFDFATFKAALQEIATMRRTVGSTGEQSAGNNNNRDALNAQGAFTPCVSQLVKDAFAPKKERRVHLRQAGKEFSVEQTAMDLLQTGFNVLGFQGRKAAKSSSRVTQNDVWIVFVIGGVSWFEVAHLSKTLQDLRDSGAQKVPKRVLVGGTTITSTTQILHGLLQTSGSSDEPSSVYAELFS